MANKIINNNNEIAKDNNILLKEINDKLNIILDVLFVNPEDTEDLFYSDEEDSKKDSKEKTIDDFQKKCWNYPTIKNTDKFFIPKFTYGIPISLSIDGYNLSIIENKDVFDVISSILDRFDLSINDLEDYIDNFGCDCENCNNDDDGIDHPNHPEYDGCSCYDKYKGKCCSKEEDSKEDIKEAFEAFTFLLKEYLNKESKEY